MKTAIPLKKSEIKTANDIKHLYQELKTARIIKNWDEFAEKIKYGRSYVSRVVNGHEPFTPELKHAIIDTFLNETKNVTSDVTKKNDVWLHIPENEFQQMVLEEVSQLKATVNILKLTVAKHATILNSIADKHPISLSSLDIEEELGKLQRLIDAEADRLLAKDKKKYG